MGKFIRKIIVLACVAALFMMPTMSASAASGPTLIYNRDGDRIYEYQPALELAPGKTALLYDFQGGNYGTWYVPAGKGFDFLCYFDEGVTTLRFTRWQPYDDGVSEVDLDNTWPVFRQMTSAKSNDDHYLMSVTNTGTQTVRIYSFQGRLID